MDIEIFQHIIEIFKYEILLHILHVYACGKEREKERLGILFYARREIFRRW